MESNKLYKLISISRLVVITYSYKYENDMDEFISKIPHTPISKIGLDFNFLSLIRDNKIGQIIGNVDTKPTFIFDTMDVEVDGGSSIAPLSRRIRDLITSFQNSFPNYQLIITAPTYKNMDGYGSDGFSSRSDLIYSCDLAISIGEEISIIKNRVGYYEKFSIETELKPC